MQLTTADNEPDFIFSCIHTQIRHNKLCWKELPGGEDAAPGGRRWLLGLGEVVYYVACGLGPPATCSFRAACAIAVPSWGRGPAKLLSYD